ncbi:MAG TPA: hypothetical protein VIH99_03320 [Bdellovibrionota bacterium]|jgi:hypothetical protein
MRYFIAIALLLGPTPTEASRKPSVAPPDSSCEAKAWPFARAQNKKDLYKLFRLSSRAKLEKYYFHELTRADGQSDALPYYLAFYLVHTENHKPTKAFYDFLRWGAELEGPDQAPHRMALEKICGFQRKFASLTPKDFKKRK